MLRVRVPATTANLGAGFDVLGLSLSLHNEIEATTAASLSITVEGEGAAELPRDATNLVWQAAQRAYACVGVTPSGARLHMRNAIPLESGLGSSAAAIVAGLLLGNALVGDKLDRDTLLALAIDMEGHPDNVAPAMLGGLVAGARDDAGRPIVRRLPIPALKAVVVMPEARLSTAAARRALPSTIPMSDAVFNLGRLALTIAAFQAGDYALLAQAMGDRLHQPYRAPLVPGLADALAAARAQGAAAAISGAGPAVVGFAAQGHEGLAAGITECFARVGYGARSWVLDVAEGASIADGAT
ncbi:MAG: homoserine kinase [Anaerolineae bacterium]